MRLCSVHLPGRDTPQLCVEEVEGALRPVEGYSDVSSLLEAKPAATSIADAVAQAGLGHETVGRWDDVVATRSSIDGARPAPPAVPAEVWAAGVTYERSRDARMEESEHQDAYQRIYDAERPELFLKATRRRVAGPWDEIGLRSDSRWQVPEPELGLVLGEGGAILGYTLGNDVSSRDIEGENTLYLPQAKIFAGSCSIGPVVLTADEIADPYSIEITLTIVRDGAAIFEDRTSTALFHVRLERLVEYLVRDNWIAPGTVLLTGTGIVPEDALTLHPGDRVDISAPPIGVLSNRCAPAASLSVPRLA